MPDSTSNTPAFYTDHIPQSEYRRTKEVRSRGDRARFNVSLSKVAVTDPHLKKALRERILQEDAQLVATLLPASVCSAMDKAYLDRILEALGL